MGHEQILGLFMGTNGNLVTSPGNGSVALYAGECPPMAPTPPVLHSLSSAPSHSLGLPRPLKAQKPPSARRKQARRPFGPVSHLAQRKKGRKHTKKEVKRNWAFNMGSGNNLAKTALLRNRSQNPLLSYEFFSRELPIGHALAKLHRSSIMAWSMECASGYSPAVGLATFDGEIMRAGLFQ